MFVVAPNGQHPTLHSTPVRPQLLNNTRQPGALGTQPIRILNSVGNVIRTTNMINNNSGSQEMLTVKW
jgi:hypothetical protein